VTGDGLSEKQVARAIKLSAEKYCSVSHMLQATVNITHTHEINPNK
jgi:putative redox protein